ncbi:hypothetical protein GOODEAATRI_008349 [Goodea atripinnis]|uniref:Secreted protein n=1 Tax=Goodea atripinnis TaxID=208336 RepID=A0ABV0PM42_9TELE
MSACAASTLDCAALGTTTWPSLLSHRVWAAVTLWSLSPRSRKAPSTNILIYLTKTPQLCYKLEPNTLRSIRFLLGLWYLSGRP